MNDDKKLPKYYYSAPQIPLENENPFFDPFMDVPALDDKEAVRPGDLFRSADGTSSQVQKTTYSNRDIYSPPRAGKLNWPTHQLLK